MAEEVITVYKLDVQPALAGLDRLLEAEEALQRAVQNGGALRTATATQAAQAALNYQQQLSGATAEVRNAQAATRAVADEVRRLVQANRELVEAQKAAGNGTAEYQRLQRELEKNLSKIKEAKAAILESLVATEQQRAAVEAVREARQAETAQTKLAAAAAKDAATATKEGAAAAKASASATGSDSSAGGGFFGSLLGKVTAATGGLFAFSAIVDKVKQGLSDYSALTGVQATLKALTGSAAAGGREFTYIKDQANALGLELIPTAKAYAGLFAAAKEANIPVAQTRAIFEGVTSAAKVLNLTADDTNGVLLALQQITSKGTVASEELRGQIGERLPGAFGLAAKAMGLTTVELGKQLQAGKILATDFLPKFAAQLKATYGNATADAAQQVGSNLGRINTFFQESSAKIGAFLAPAIKYVADFVSSTKRASVATAEEQLKLEESLLAITSLNVGNSERTRLIKELQAEYPALLGNINAEKVSNEELSGAIDKVSASLVNRLLLEKQQEKIADQAGKTADALRKRLEAEIEIRQQLAKIYLEREKNVNSSNGVRAINDNGSVGFGADIRKENQGLPLDVAAQNTLDQIAKRKVSISTLSPAYEALSKATEKYRIAQVALNTEEDKGNELTRQKAAFMQALGISTAASTGALSGNAAALTKSIDALQAHRKAIQDQLNALQTNDYNDPKYRAKLAAFRADIEKTDALIKELEGKQDKTAAGRENKQKRLLEAYVREQQTYKELALKAAEQQEEDAKAASERQFQLDLTNIYEASRKLKAAKKANGEGGEFTVGQREEENTLLQGAYKAHYDRLLAIQRTKQDQLLALQKEGDDKQLKALDIAFEREKEKYANQPAQLKAAIEKYGRDKAKLLLDQEQKRLDEQQALDLAVAESAALDFPDPVKAEEVRQQGVYAVKLKYALKEVDLKKRVAASDDSTINQKALQDAKNAYDALLKIGKPDKGFDIYKFVLGNEANNDENRRKLDKAVSNSLNAIQQVLQAEVQASQVVIQNKTQEINQKQHEIDREYQYNSQGSASNIANKAAELQTLKQQRREAIEEQKRAQKAQLLLDTAIQASGLITAVSETYAGFAAIPVIGPVLGIAAGALLIGSFIAAKAQAFSAVNSQGGPGFFKGGLGTTGYTGEGNPQDESRALGRKDYTYHRKEFIFDHKTTADYHKSLFEPLHQGRPQDIQWNSPKLRAILPDYTLPDYTLPGKLKEERQAQMQHHFHLSNEPVRAELVGMRTKLDAIEKSNAQMAEKPDVVPVPGGYLMRWANGSTERVKLLDM